MTAEDQGEYSCQASNKAGLQITKASLSVEQEQKKSDSVPKENGGSVTNGVEQPKETPESGPLKVVKDVEAIVATAGESLALECTFEGLYCLSQALCCSVFKPL